MNQLLFNRSTGDLSPTAFTRIQASRRILSIQAAPGLRFNGGEREALAVNDDVSESSELARMASQSKTWAHQAGVGALALDLDGRMCVLLISHV